MSRFLILMLITFSLKVAGQPNCNIYKMNNDEQCYEACLIATEAAKYQGTGESQLRLDKAIELCPTLDYAYFQKSIPYLKRGDFITWKKLIDKAVELNPSAHLGYRAWCRFQFVRDYRGALEDFEKLPPLLPYDIGYSQNGDYHLNIAKALCYKVLGEKNKAIQIIEDQLSKEGYSPMPYDFLHLGVLKMETNDLEGAIKFLKKQIDYNDYLADTYYYLALAYKALKQPENFTANMKKAREYYLKGYRRLDPYTHPMDKIYLDDIESELNQVR